MRKSTEYMLMNKGDYRRVAHENHLEKRRKERNKCNCNEKRRSFSIPDSWIM